MSFDFTVLGERIVGDLRGVLSFRHFGHGQLQALVDSRMVADRDNRVLQREATPLETDLLRYLNLIPAYNLEVTERIRAVITWYGPVRGLNFTRNGTPISDPQDTP